jgi:hypothetical protein
MSRISLNVIGSALLTMGLASGTLSPVLAQMTSGPGLSSGSGEGTGAGGFSGVVRNRSGSISGTGPRPSSIYVESPLPGPRPRAPLVGFGPDVDIRFPNDPFIIPFMVLEQPGTTDENAPTQITADNLRDARLIKTAEERSLALQRIAQGATARGQFFLAHKTLEEAITAASDVKEPLVRDQRLIALVTSLTKLADALLFAGRQKRSAIDFSLPGAKPVKPVPLPDTKPAPPALPDATPPKPAPVRDSKPAPPASPGPKLGDVPAAMPAEPLPDATDKKVLMRMVRLDWKRAIYLAELINDPTYRNEMLYEIADKQADGSRIIANETHDADAQANLKLADELLVDAFDVTKKIDRLIWRYRALYRISLQAADSMQYSRGIELAKQIENGESRAEAMLLLAASQSRNNQSQAATATYQYAAEAVATVQQDGLRGVLAELVVDSLVVTGRYEDARACVVLYPTQSQRLVALGSIAKSQGSRGAAESARRWIATEVPAEFRPTLYRQVMTGVLDAIEQNRPKDSLN